MNRKTTGSLDLESSKHYISNILKVPPFGLGSVLYESVDQQLVSVPGRNVQWCAAITVYTIYVRSYDQNREHKMTAVNFILFSFYNYIEQYVVLIV